MNPIFAVSMLRLVLGPVVEDVVSDAAVNGGRDGVRDVRVDIYVTAKVVRSVFEIVHSDDGGGEETLVVVVDFAVSVGSRVAIDIGYDDVLVLNVSGDNDLRPSSCGFEQVGVVVVVLAGDGLSGGDSSDAFSTSCVLGGGQIGGGWESDMSFCIFCLVADSGNEVLGYVSFLDGQDVAGQEESLYDVKWEAAYVPARDDNRIALGRRAGRQHAGVNGSVVCVNMLRDAVGGDVPVSILGSTAQSIRTRRCKSIGAPSGSMPSATPNFLVSFMNWRNWNRSWESVGGLPTQAVVKSVMWWCMCDISVVYW